MAEILILVVMCWLSWKGGRNKQRRQDEEEIAGYKQYIQELHAALCANSAQIVEPSADYAEKVSPSTKLPEEAPAQPNPSARPKLGTKEEWVSLAVILAVIVFVGVIYGVTHNDSAPPQNATKETTKETFNADKYRETEKETQKQTTKFEEPEKYGAGHYKVGIDIPAGTYIIFEDGTLGSFEYSEDAEGKDNSEFSFLSGHAIIEVKKGEYLEISRAYAIPYNEYYKFDVVDGYLGEGDYIIGDQIPAGEYRIEVVDDSAIPSYWIYDGVRRNKTVDWKYIENNHYINVKDGELLDLSGCKIYIGK